jgi:hypothetical protein
MFVYFALHLVGAAVAAAVIPTAAGNPTHRSNVTQVVIFVVVFSHHICT